ncbi:hypothetical protein FACS189485_13500 [Spirochaetia bacterium]|nr:hypothetical protein FACS189485_13500 [Spirochaetia bacterium]
MRSAPARFARIILFVSILFFSHTLTVWAQAGETETDETGAAELPTQTPEELPAEKPDAPPGLSPEENVIDMDIKTSTLAELAAWCRSLGLSEGGTRDDLARRLRDHFKVPLVPAGASAPGNKKTITIESARSTEYFTLDVVDEEYARLRGDVIVSLKDGEALHRITAREILYNRTRNLLTAEGGVTYVKEEGDTVETFRGDNITVNLDNWSSVFMNSVSEKSLKNDETTYRFAGTVISRSDEEVTILTNAEISNAVNPEAFWSLKAGKLWLLPGSDFAIFNAVLKVGEIPVMYIPFLYWPADEVVFHPVLGIRSREGNFMQTTTYILGRPKTDTTSESSISRILGNGSDMKKERDGIFLRSTGKKDTDPNEISLKAIVDWYVNLGGYFGTELTLPRMGILNSLELSGGIGITRDVVRIQNGANPFYTPFARYDGTSDWNSSRFFSMDVPFRYRLNTKGSLGGQYGSLSWALPFYSDPYVNKDFLNRSEVMDWIRMMQDGAAIVEDGTAGNSVLGAYEWQMNGAVTPPIAKLHPYVSTLSLSSFTSTVAFRTRPSTKYQNDYSPNRTFFYPDKFTLYSMSLAIAGTPLTIGGSAAAAAEKAKAPPPEDDPFKDIGVPRSPWETPAEESDGGTTDSMNLVPPALGQRFDINRLGGPQFSIDYRLNPSAASELQFRNSADETGTYHWKEAEDIDWGEVSSVLSTVRGDASTSFNLNDVNGLYANTFRLSGTGSWQDYNYANEEAEEFTTGGVLDTSKMRSARNRAYAATSFSTSYDFSTTVKPLYQSPVWGNSSLQYSIKGLIAKSEFIAPIGGEDPEWDIKYGAWNKENLDSHQFTVNIAANVMDKVQNLTLATDLPPEEKTLSGNLTLRAWIAEFNTRMRIVFPDYDNKPTAAPVPGEEKKPYKLEPLYMTGSLKFGKYGSFSQYAVFDAEEKEFTTLTTNLSLVGFTAAYRAIRSVPYVFNFNNPDGSANGWILRPDKKEELHPQDLSFGYAQTFKQVDLWQKRLSFSVNVNTNMVFDLQRYTYSRLNFTLGFTLGINKFIDIAFSATSENALMYRYFKDIPGFELPIEIPEGDQNNFFLDLFNSFRFDNDDLRKRSGFKLKTLKLDVTHHLGDWNAKLGMTVSPYLPAGATEYKFNNEISFVVQWIPISEVKTEMKYTKEEWTFK